MAAIESNGFALSVQTGHFRFVFIVRSIPLRVAHPPPLRCPTEFLGPFESAPNSIGDVRSDTSINFRTAAL